MTSKKQPEFAVVIDKTGKKGEKGSVCGLYSLEDFEPEEIVKDFEDHESIGDTLGIKMRPEVLELFHSTREFYKSLTKGISESEPLHLFDEMIRTLIIDSIDHGVKVQRKNK